MHSILCFLPTTVINFQLSESDYTQNEEPNALLEILITKGSGIQLANPVYFRVTLLTVEDALTRGVISEFDAENPFSPNRAGKHRVLLFFSFTIDSQRMGIIYFTFKTFFLKT